MERIDIVGLLNRMNNEGGHGIRNHDEMTSALTALRSGEVEVVDGGRLQEVCNELDRHNVSPIIDYDVVTLSEKWLAYLQRREEGEENG